MVNAVDLAWGGVSLTVYAILSVTGHDSAADPIFYLTEIVKLIFGGLAVIFGIAIHTASKKKTWVKKFVDWFGKGFKR